MSAVAARQPAWSPRWNVAEVLQQLRVADAALSRLEGQKPELTGPGQLVGVWDLRRVFNECLTKAHQVAGAFPAHDELVEGPGREEGTHLPSPLSAAGVPEQHPTAAAVEWPELAEGQIWLSCYANDSWRVEALNPATGETGTVLLRALDGPHQGKTAVVRVGEVLDQAIPVPRLRAVEDEHPHACPTRPCDYHDAEAS